MFEWSVCLVSPLFNGTYVWFWKHIKNGNATECVIRPKRILDQLSLTDHPWATGVQVPTGVTRTGFASSMLMLLVRLGQFGKLHSKKEKVLKLDSIQSLCFLWIQRPELKMATLRRFHSQINSFLEKCWLCIKKLFFSHTWLFTKCRRRCGEKKASAASAVDSANAALTGY